MSHFSNGRKEKFLNTFPPISLDDKNNNLTNRCKFNFSFLDESQEYSEKIENFTELQLQKILQKLKDFSRFSLSELKKQPIGSGKNRKNLLEIYGAFPRNSDFTHPKHVPHQVSWGRFRMEQDFRLVGFVIPEEYQGKFHSVFRQTYDLNTFYIVFFDTKHKFYRSEKA